MKTFTICGSMRFAKEMQVIAFDLETRHGFNVLQCVYGDGEHLTPEQRAKLAAPHAQKIALSDGIYVVDIGGYVGQSTQNKIDLARAQAKEVIFHTGFYR